MYSIDIDMYNEGYSIKNMDCIDIPIAAACGAYDNNNYYYYGCFRLLNDNWGSTFVDDNYFVNNDPILRSKSAVLPLGLKIETYIEENSNAVIDKIKSSLKNHEPIVVLVAYGSLFYNHLYKRTIEPAWFKHAIIIDEWNDDTNVFRIRDSAFLRLSDVFNNISADRIFPLNITEVMLGDILNLNRDLYYDKTDKQFIYAYVIKNDRVQEINNFDKMFKYMVKEMTPNKSLIIKMINDFGKYSDIILSNSEGVKRRLGNVFEILFKSFEIWMKYDTKNILNKLNYFDFKTNFLKDRDLLISKIYKYALKGISLNQSQKSSLIEKVLDQEKGLLLFINKLIKYNINNNEQYIPIDLSKYFNNEIFTTDVSKCNTDDLSGTRLRYQYPIQDKIVKQRDEKIYNQIIKINDGEKDNISCNGQLVSIQEGRYSKIMFLICSDYGSYEENINFFYNNEEIETKKICVTDFATLPLFNEKVIWMGTAALKCENRVEILNTTAKISEFCIVLKDEMINQIKLPNNNFLHIFSITLVSKQDIPQ